MLADVTDADSNHVSVSKDPLGVLFQDISYDVTWSARSSMGWFAWLRSLCSRGMPPLKRTGLHSLSGIVQPGELYVIAGCLSFGPLKV